MTTLWLFAGLAHAGLFDVFEQGVTFCVGGYDGDPPSVTAACELPAQAKLHSSWHHHVYLFDGTRCWSCWDEVDNTCISSFLDKNPLWRAVEAYDAVCAVHAGSDEVFAHIIDGQAATPPPDPTTALTPRVDHADPGPYAAGDTIEVRGSLRDLTGHVRPVTKGTFRVRAADGSVHDVPGERLLDGTFRANVTLPATDGVDVQFIPGTPTLGANERIAAVASAPLSIAVEACRYRARVVAPSAGEPLTSGQPATLRAALFDAADAAPVSVAASLEFVVDAVGQAQGRLQASAAFEASWIPPASPDPRAVTVSASGTADGFPVCPSRRFTGTFSDVGLGFDTSDLPRRCYQGLRCEGDVVLRRPDAGAARTRVDALLAAPGVEVVLSDNGHELWRGPPRADDRYTFDAVYADLSAHSLALEVTRPTGSPIAMPRHEMHVRPPLRVHLPATLDLGTHRAGTAWSTTCVDLDMSRSQAAQEHEWRIRAEGLGNCEGRPVLGLTNAHGRQDSLPLDEELTLKAFDPKRPVFSICLDVPRCAGDTSPPAAALRITPVTPEFADQERIVAVRWRVEERSMYDCQAWWLQPVGGTLGALFLAAGFLRPARFSRGASLRVAGTEAGVRRAACILLRDCPGASARFYRDACLGLHLDGTVNGRARGAAVRLRATRDRGLVLTGGGTVERLDAATRKWQPVEDLAAGHAPSPRAIYRVGSTYFQVDAG